jgi:hypothetical protein
MSFSKIVLFVGLGGVVGFAGGLFAIEGALIAIPVANRRVRLHPTRLAGNGDGDGSFQRECDLADLCAKEALAGSRWPNHDGLQYGTGARVLPNSAVR